MSRMEVVHIAAGIALAVLALGAVVLLRSEDALRDDSTARPKPFSFARVQLFWWTLVIIGAYIAAYGLTGRLLEMSSTCLILLGISTGTTASARMIDKDQAQRASTRHQDDASEGFFCDILSDENGLSVHRFQAVVLNLFIGLTFLIDVFTDLSSKEAFPTLDGYMLALLGVSSGTYLTLKTMENPTPAPTARAAEAPASDELLDPIGPMLPESH